MKILIVEDDIIYSDVLKQALIQQMNAAVETARDIRCVQSNADQFKPDVILLDLELGAPPESSGFPVLRNLKRGYITKNIPIIILTGFRDSVSLKTALRWGINDYVIKPAEIEDLIKRITRLCSKNEG